MTLMWIKSLDSLMDHFTQDIALKSPRERELAYEELQKAFEAKFLILKNKMTEIEYGQHVEGLYDISYETIKPKGPF